MLTIDPYEMLHQLDSDVRLAARKLPLEVLTADWVGVEVSCLGAPCLIALSNVYEMIAPSHITHVPYAQPWLRGVVNVRGALIPVTDVAYWLSGKPTAIDKTRILVVQHEHELYGLLFEQVLGMQRLSGVTFQSVVEAPAFLSPFIENQLQVSSKRWFVLDLGRLLSQDTFYQTALAS